VIKSNCATNQHLLCFLHCIRWNVHQ